MPATVPVAGGRYSSNFLPPSSPSADGERCIKFGSSIDWALSIRSAGASPPTSTSAVHAILTSPLVVPPVSALAGLPQTPLDFFPSGFAGKAQPRLRRFSWRSLNVCRPGGRGVPAPPAARN